MAKLKQSIQRTNERVAGRPTPNTPKAGYTSDGSRYDKGGKLRKKKA